MKKVVFICACVAAVITLCAICFNRASSLEGLAKANVEVLADVDPEVTTIPCKRAVSRCEFPAKDEEGFEFTMLVTGFMLKTDE